MILTIKQLKRRFMHGLVEPELFYMPWGSMSTLTVNLISYSTYDINNNCIIEDMNKTISVKGAIVIVDSNNKVVYNSKRLSDRSNFKIQLPYGKYKIKVIRTYNRKADNKWYEITINKKVSIIDIILPWYKVIKTEEYVSDELQPYVLIGDCGSPYLSFNNIELKGQAYCRIYEDNVLILDEPYRDNMSINRIYTIGTYESYGISDEISIYGISPSTQISLRYLMKAVGDDIKTEGCDISWTKTPIRIGRWKPDLDSQIIEGRLTNQISNGEYSGEFLYTNILPTESSNQASNIDNVKYKCIYNRKPQEDVGDNWYKYPSDIEGEGFCTSDFSIWGESSVIRLFGTYQMIEEYARYKNYHESDNYYEYNGDPFFFLNNIMILIVWKEDTIHHIPYSEFVSYIGSRNEYDEKVQEINNGASDIDVNKYEFIIINLNTHHPYECIKDFELYSYSTDSNGFYSGNRHRQNQVKGIYNNEEYDVSQGITLDIDGINTSYSFPSYVDYSDDYDKY